MSLTSAIAALLFLGEIKSEPEAPLVTTAPLELRHAVGATRSQLANFCTNTCTLVQSIQVPAESQMLCLN